MEVLVLATDELKEELLECPVSSDIQFHWLTAPASVSSFPAADACIDLLFEHSPERINWLKQLKVPLIVINSVISCLADIQEDFVRINGWSTFLKRPVMEAVGREAATRQLATHLFSLLGRKTEWVPDIPGMITPRVVACIINEAFMALEEKVSHEKEINTALKLGTNYPYGPLEWGQKIGLQPVYTLLETLSKEEDRYQPAGLLKEKILV